MNFGYDAVVDAGGEVELIGVLQKLRRYKELSDKLETRSGGGAGGGSTSTSRSGIDKDASIDSYDGENVNLIMVSQAKQDELRSMETGVKANGEVRRDYKKKGG